VGCFAAIHLKNVQDAAILNNRLSSQSRGISMEGNIYNIQIGNNRIYGNSASTVGYFLETGPGKGFVDVWGTNTVSGAYGLKMLTNDFAAMSSIRSAPTVGHPDALGLTVATIGGPWGGRWGTLDLWDATGGPTPHKSFRVNGGVLEIQNNALSKIFQMDNAGNAEFGGHVGATAATSPALSSCGTSPSIVGSDSAGKVTMGSGTLTSCTVTFAAAWTHAPACTTDDESATGIVAVTNSTTTMAMTIRATSLTSKVVSYICIGY
jgi:parallel beta-helix repeat protein